MREIISAAAKGAVKIPLGLQAKLAGKVFEAVLFTPFLPSKEDYETPFFAGKVALVGDSCATSPVLARTVAETLNSSGIIDGAEKVVVRPLLPPHDTYGADNKKPVKAAKRLANVLLEDYGVEIEPDDLQREGIRRMTPGQHDSKSLTALLDKECELPQIGVIPAFIGHELLRTPQNANIYQTLNGGGAVELHQAPHLGAVKDEWIPDQPVVIRGQS